MAGGGGGHAEREGGTLRERERMVRRGQLNTMRERGTLRERGNGLQQREEMDSN